MADLSKIDTKTLRRLHAVLQHAASLTGCEATQRTADRGWAELVARRAIY